MRANNIEDGPTRGTTLILFSCANFTISDPGSAIPGHPASEIKAISFPSKQGFKKLLISYFVVCLFNL